MKNIKKVAAGECEWGLGVGVEANRDVGLTQDKKKPAQRPSGLGPGTADRGPAWHQPRGGHGLEVLKHQKEGRCGWAQ